MKSNILAVKSYGVFIFLSLMLVSLKAQDGNVKTYYPSGITGFISLNLEKMKLCELESRPSVLFKGCPIFNPIVHNLVSPALSTPNYCD